MGWTYSQDLHERSTIQPALADRFLAELRQLIAERGASARREA